MSLTCKTADCDGATKLTGSNGETDPERDRVEFYECEYGHTFTVILGGIR